MNLDKLKKGDVINIGKYECTVAHSHHGYFLHKEHAEADHMNSDIFTQFNVTVEQLNKMLGYETTGSFPFCKTLYDLIRIIKFLKEKKKSLEMFPENGFCKSTDQRLIDCLKASGRDHKYYVDNSYSGVAWNKEHYWMIKSTSDKPLYTLSHLEKFFTKKETFPEYVKVTKIGKSFTTYSKGDKYVNYARNKIPTEGEIYKVVEYFDIRPNVKAYAIERNNELFIVGEDGVEPCDAPVTSAEEQWIPKEGDWIVSLSDKGSWRRRGDVFQALKGTTSGLIYYQPKGQPSSKNSLRRHWRKALPHEIPSEGKSNGSSKIVLEKGKWYTSPKYHNGVNDIFQFDYENDNSVYFTATIRKGVYSEKKGYWYKIEDLKEVPFEKISKYIPKSIETFEDQNTSSYFKPKEITFEGKNVTAIGENIFGYIILFDKGWTLTRNYISLYNINPKYLFQSVYFITKDDASVVQNSPITEIKRQIELPLIEVKKRFT